MTDAEFRSIEATVAAPTALHVEVVAGEIEPVDRRRAYVDRDVSFIDPASLAPMRFVANAGKGAAGPTSDAIAAALAARGRSSQDWFPFHSQNMTVVARVTAERKTFGHLS